MDIHFEQHNNRESRNITNPIALQFVVSSALVVITSQLVEIKVRDLIGWAKSQGHSVNEKVNGRNHIKIESSENNEFATLPADLNEEIDPVYEKKLKKRLSRSNNIDDSSQSSAYCSSCGDPAGTNQYCSTCYWHSSITYD